MGLKINNNQKRAAGVAATFFAIAFAGCAPAVNAPPDKIVAELANERWVALIDGDYAKAYEFTAPSFRAVVDLKTYQKKFAGGGVVWSGAKTSKVACEADKCNVTVDVTGTALAGTTRLTRTVPVSEVWVLEKNRWWQFDKF